MLKLKKKHEVIYFFLKKKHVNPGESLRLGLIFQTRNMWNPISWLNQEAQFSTNIILKNETKKINLENFSR